jgi:hypothetical protein
MEKIECSETLTFKLQMPVNHPEESIAVAYMGISPAVKIAVMNF